MRVAIFVVIASSWAGAAAAQLPPPVQRILDGHSISPQDISVLVQPVSGDEPIVSHLPAVPRNPASTIKTVTTWVALDTLGPTYYWPTEVYFLGEFADGALDGDLALKGFGDPYLVTEEIWKLLRALRRTGLEDVRGDLLIDDTYFERVDEDPGAFDGQPFRTYNVLPSALLINFKAVRFQFLPDHANAAVRISADPAPTNLDIDNRLRLVDGPCRGYQAGIAFDLADFPTGRRAVFSGNFPAACAPYSLSRTVLEHDSFAYGVYRTLWAELGGRHRGGLRRGVVPQDTEPALTWRSRPLAEIIRSVNKFSNNVMTRQLLHTLGAERDGPPGTAAAGIAVIHEYLEAHGIESGGLVIDNGAGLSRATRISAEALTGVLLTAARSPLAPEFLASLSLGGLDGTTRGRFNGHEVSGRMHVKTGRLDHVSALVGLVHARSGVDYATVVMVNSPDAHRGPGTELQEALVRWVYELP
ncbi:MAG: D-alanyl-D-alanine carboxypeptidase/D-alanyl-D-alanine-endopeptidase [Gammaproteobacteria bacterium]|nr:D-alanyl-D-alanine carboxypeptidase/D-alanyl-D-alanine-endopeptidase [Gammaproteobacteria bacterium]MDH3506587.1 D-alanyl-D-alanine carboxypeptidase/D-alanyl-D-alanine-endopeptidase [Gammaproteobacteria bacterium]